MRKLSVIALYLIASQADGRCDDGSGTFSKHYQSCSDNAQGSYTHILACQGEEQAVQESRLNKTYSAIMRRLGSAEQRLLRKSELKWLTLRDKRCELPRPNGGLSDLVDSRECRLSETRRRTIWLERYR